MSNTYSGYGATKVINERLKAENLPEIPPQMVYQYISKGMIKASGQKGDRGRKVTEATLTEWLERYVAKKKANVTSNETAIEAQLAGE